MTPASIRNTRKQGSWLLWSRCKARLPRKYSLSTQSAQKSENFIAFDDYFINGKLLRNVTYFLRTKFSNLRALKSLHNHWYVWFDSFPYAFVHFLFISDSCWSPLRPARNPAGLWNSGFLKPGLEFRTGFCRPGQSPEAEKSRKKTGTLCLSPYHVLGYADERITDLASSISSAGSHNLRTFFLSPHENL